MFYQASLNLFGIQYLYGVKTILSKKYLLSFFWWYVNFLTFVFFSLLFALPTEIILLAILFPIKSPVASVVFLTTLLEVVFAASIPAFVEVSNNFLPYLYYQIFFQMSKSHIL